MISFHCEIMLVIQMRILIHVRHLMRRIIVHIPTTHKPHTNHKETNVSER
jgi:hypothetical protein